MRVHMLINGTNNNKNKAQKHLVCFFIFFASMTTFQCFGFYQIYGSLFFHLLPKSFLGLKFIRTKGFQFKPNNHAIYDHARFA